MLKTHAAGRRDPRPRCSAARRSWRSRRRCALADGAHASGRRVEVARGTLPCAPLRHRADGRGPRLRSAAQRPVCRLRRAADSVPLRAIWVRHLLLAIAVGRASRRRANRFFSVRPRRLQQDPGWQVASCPHAGMTCDNAEFGRPPWRAARSPHVRCRDVRLRSFRVPAGAADSLPGGRRARTSRRKATLAGRTCKARLPVEVSMIHQRLALERRACCRSPYSPRRRAAGAARDCEADSNPVLVTSTSLPAMLSGEPLEHEIPIVGGCGGPYILTADPRGSAPGADLDSETHSIRGVLLEDGEFAFTVQVTDRGCDPSSTTIASFTISVGVGEITVVDVLRAESQTDSYRSVPASPGRSGRDELQPGLPGASAAVYNVVRGARPEGCRWTRRPTTCRSTAARPLRGRRSAPARRR